MAKCKTKAAGLLCSGFWLGNVSHGGWQWRGTSSVEKRPHLSKYLSFPEKQIKWLIYK